MRCMFFGYNFEPRRNREENLLVHVVMVAKFLAPVVQKVDSNIHRINLYPLGSAIGLPNTVEPRYFELG